MKCSAGFSSGIPVVSVLALLLATAAFAQTPSAKPGSGAGTAAKAVVEPAAIKSAELGDTVNVHSSGTLYFSGQFSAEDIAALQAAGIQRVITLRTDGEVDWNEKAALEAAGIEFQAVPFRAPETLTDEVFDSVRQLLGDKEKTTLFHCGSANRVGAAWLPYRVLDEGVPLETAVAESKVIGLRTEELLDKARRYIRRKQINRKPGVTAKPLVEDDMVDETPPEASGSPPLQSQDPASRGGINDAFVNPDLNVDEFVKRFEIESREIYASRDAVMAACQVKPGERIADVGAGTGLYTRLFATAVGEGGWVYAIDIAPRFIEHINVTARDAGLENVTGIVNSQSSINLPPQSVDLVFICDTYHHFEAPEKILASISRALKPGGQLVLIDFERVPGTSREWVVSHVRAGREVFRGEIEAAGLEFVEQRAIPGFSENYFLRFVKK